MWMLARCLAAVIFGLLGYFRGKTRVQSRKNAGDTEWLLNQSRNKGRVYYTRFGVGCPKPIVFRLTRLRPWDRFFTRIGFSRAWQTGNGEFDARIYIACDHPAMQPILQDREAQDAILSLFRHRVAEVYGDGKNLWAGRSGDQPPDESEIAQLVILRDLLDAVPAEALPTVDDPYVQPARALKAILWAAAAYGVPGFFEYIWSHRPLYLDWMPVYERAAVASVLIFLGLVVANRILLRGSSRSHRVFTENFFALSLAVSLFAFVATSDANIVLDGSMPEFVRAQVAHRYTRVYHGKGAHTEYFLALDSRDAAAGSLPPTLEVSRQAYASAQWGGTAIVTLHAGALGARWVETIRVEN